MAWSTSDTIAIITLAVAIPTSFVGIWTLVLCLQARQSGRGVHPLHPVPEGLEHSMYDDAEASAVLQGYTPTQAPKYSVQMQVLAQRRDFQYRYFMREPSIDPPSPSATY
ncbi:hypothetical protein BJY04DRAFT_213425 [Aspergillus karnatakaensis]|uniref:uncharacterized protein n=1 Tax=Aspergillus karnatakaensis TaxID=1810916 RepID=UPI003CCD9BBD